MLQGGKEEALTAVAVAREVYFVMMGANLFFDDSDYYRYDHGELSVVRRYCQYYCRFQGILE